MPPHSAQPDLARPQLRVPPAGHWWIPQQLLAQLWRPGWVKGRRRFSPALLQAPAELPCASHLSLPTRRTLLCNCLARLRCLRADICLALQELGNHQHMDADANVDGIVEIGRLQISLLYACYVIDECAGADGKACLVRATAAADCSRKNLEREALTAPKWGCTFTRSRSQHDIWRCVFSACTHSQSDCSLSDSICCQRHRCAHMRTIKFVIVTLIQLPLDGSIGVNSNFLPGCSYWELP